MEGRGAPSHTGEEMDVTFLHSFPSLPSLASFCLACLFWGAFPDCLSRPLHVPRDWTASLLCPWPKIRTTLPSGAGLPCQVSALGSSAQEALLLLRRLSGLEPLPGLHACLWALLPLRPQG